MEQIPHIVSEREITYSFVPGATLGPDEINRGTRGIFPSNDEIRTKLTEIKIRILNRIIKDPIPILID